MYKSPLEREHDRHAAKFHRPAACGKTEMLLHAADASAYRYAPNSPFDVFIYVEVPRYLPAMMFGEYSFEWEHPLYKMLADGLKPGNLELAKPWKSDSPTVMPPVYGSDTNDLPNDLAQSFYHPRFLNQLARDIHVNDNAKWWHDLKTGEKLDRNKGEMLMLVVSELAEAMEGVRKDLMDDKLSHRKMVEVELADAVIRILDYAHGHDMDLDTQMRSARHLPTMSTNKAEELLSIVKAVGYATTGYKIHDTRALCRALRLIKRYADRYGLDLVGAIKEKRAFNRTREDHSTEARLAAGGKKF